MQNRVFLLMCRHNSSTFWKSSVELPHPFAWNLANKNLLSSKKWSSIQSLLPLPIIIPTRKGKDHTTVIHAGTLFNLHCFWDNLTQTSCSYSSPCKTPGHFSLPTYMQLQLVTYNFWTWRLMRDIDWGAPNHCIARAKLVRIIFAE